MPISAGEEISACIGLKDLARSNALRNGTGDCLLAPGRSSLSFEGLFNQICGVESWLRAAAIGPGDCVASALPNGPEAAGAFLAFASSCLYAPLNRDDDDSALDFAFATLRPSAFLAEAGDAAASRAAAAAERAGIPVITAVSPAGSPAGLFKLSGCVTGRELSGPDGEPGLLMQTSGTTGRPKFVRHTHSTLFHAARFLTQTYRLTPADRCLNFSPLFHSLGLVGSVLLAISSGGSIVLTPGFDAGEFFHWIRDFSPTWFSAVPSVHTAIGKLAAKHQEILRSHPLRFSRFGGASLADETRQEIQDMLQAPVVQVYGMSECPPIAADPFPPAARKIGSVGVSAGPEVAIWDDEDRPLGVNCSGHVVVRGPNLMAGYFRDAAANQAIFSNGWLRTGDCGYLDTDGFLFLTGRVREFINRGGEKVAPAEIDEMFGRHPDVALAVTFPIPDRRLGEEVATAIIPKQAGAVTAGQLARFAATRLAFHKIPRRIYLVPQIPLGRTGKPDRAALRAHFARLNGLPEERVVPRVEPRTDIEKKIAAVWVEVLGVRNPSIHDDFFDSGGDSLAAISLVHRLAEKLEAKSLGPGILVQAPTIAELAILFSARDTGSELGLLPLRPGGNGTPLFWIDGFGVHGVVEAMDRDRPVFLAPLQLPPDPDNGGTIENYAETCLRALRRFRPKGPYHVAGWCAAGVVALEVARRLATDGEDVGLVVFDARGVLRREDGFIASRWVAGVRVAQKFRHHLAKLREGGAANATAYVSERMQTQIGRVRRNLRDLQWRFQPPAGDGLRFRDSESLLRSALRHYRPKPYGGRIVHIWAADRPKGRFRDLEYEWGAVGCGGMEVHEVPGNHVTMFQGENARALGVVLNRVLDGMERENG